MAIPHFLRKASSSTDCVCWHKTKSWPFTTQYVFNEPQIAALKFAAWQGVGECGNTGNNAFQLAMLAIMLRMQQVERKCWPYYFSLTWIWNLTSNLEPLSRRSENFTGPKANFKVKTCWIMAQFLAHKPVQFCFVNWWYYWMIFKRIRTLIFNANRTNTKHLFGVE